MGFILSNNIKPTNNLEQEVGNYVFNEHTKQIFNIVVKKYNKTSQEVTFFIPMCLHSTPKIDIFLWCRGLLISAKNIMRGTIQNDQTLQKMRQFISDFNRIYWILLILFRINTIKQQDNESTYAMSISLITAKVTITLLQESVMIIKKIKFFLRKHICIFVWYSLWIP